MSLTAAFMTSEEEELSARFLRDGYVVVDAERPAALEALRAAVVEAACARLGCPLPDDPGAFLERIAERVPVAALNDFRLGLYNALNREAYFRPTCFALARRTLETLVGNELAMQNRINLSIQLPDDDSSLLGIHADTFSGETPFQVVQWLPLVSVSGTKSMFLLPPEHNRRIMADYMDILREGGNALLFDRVREHLIWVDVPYGKVLVFSPNLLHGNVVNRTREARWSFNTRYTGLFTPYSRGEKGLGSFYLPITPRIVSRLGLDFQFPEGFDG